MLNVVCWSLLVVVVYCCLLLNMSFGGCRYLLLFVVASCRLLFVVVVVLLSGVSLMDVFRFTLTVIVVCFSLLVDVGCRCLVFSVY